MMKFQLIFLIIFLGAVLLQSGGVNCELDREILKWRILTYGNLPPYDPDHKIGGENFYDETKNMPVGISAYRDRVFITVPRRDYGVPSTLNFIDLRQSRNNMSPPLQSYPNYTVNELSQNSEGELIGNSSRIISVYRTRIDECGRLWFVDTGVLEKNGRVEKIIQSPSIWIIDLRTNSVVRRVEIIAPFNESGHGYVNINVDMDIGRCDRIFAYMPNGVTNRILVYDFENDHMWAFEEASFLSSEKRSIIIGGMSYPIEMGVMSIALGRRNRRGIRKAYYQPFGSNDEYCVSTEILRNEEKTKLTSNPVDFKNIGTRGNTSQTIVHDHDQRTGVIFFSDLNNNSITCWDTRRPLSPENVGTVVKDDGLLIYVSDIKSDMTGNVWYISNRQNLIENRGLDKNYYNFYVFKLSTRTSLRNTVCDPQTLLRNIVKSPEGVESDQNNDENEETNIDDLDDRDGMIGAEWQDEGTQQIKIQDDLDDRDGMVSHDFDIEVMAHDHRFVDSEHVLITIDKNSETEDQKHGFIHSRQ